MIFKPFKRQPHKMVKHTQKIRRQNGCFGNSLIYNGHVLVELGNFEQANYFLTHFMPLISFYTS